MEIKNFSSGLSFQKNLVVYSREALGEQLKKEVFSVTENAVDSFMDVVKSKVNLDNMVEPVEIKDKDFVQKIINGFSDLCKKPLDYYSDRQSGIYYTPGRMEFSNGQGCNQDKGLFLVLDA